MLQKLRTWNWRRRYRPGRLLSSFVAIDIRRDVEVVDASEIESGVIRVRTRTWNVLHAIKGITPQPDFGKVHAVKISELWKWSGNPEPTKNLKRR